MKYFVSIFSLQLLLHIIFPVSVKSQPVLKTLSIDAVVPGYKETVDGEVVSFHSSNPNVHDALLVRCIEGENKIAWKTAVIPGGYEKEYIYFVWLAGLATGNGRENSRYDLFINKEKAFTINIEPGKFPQNWLLKGKNGTELSFVQHSLDNNKDAFGYMYLKVPVDGYQKGDPLLLEMIGRDSDRYDDWYMTFQQKVEEKVTSVHSRQLLRKDDNNKLEQLITIDITHKLPQPVKASIRLEDSRKQVELHQGSNHIKFWQPAVESTKEVSLEVNVPQILSYSKDITLHPVAEREVYLINHSHIDIGYSDLQPQVIKKHNQYTRQAMRLIEKTKNYPPDARFIWNIEALWAVENFMNQATEDEKRQFIEYVKNGSIGLGAGYANLLTGLCRPEELIHWTDYSKKLKNRYGISSETLMISDVPGMSWNVVPALAEREVKYISSGPNFIPQPGFPDNGGRVGATHRAWGDKPFYWVSASKQDTVLYWQAGKGYSWFQNWNVGQLSFDYKPVQSLLGYMEKLWADGYPYDMVQLRYSIINDNSPPDESISDFVAAWNKKYESPRLIISNVEDMMKTFEQRYADEIPVFSGDFTPYWEDGAMSTAREEVLVKRSVERLYQSSVLNTLLFPGNYDENKSYKAWRNVIMWHEHTWGAWNSVSQPDDPNVIKQWEYKQNFALRADSLSRALLKNQIVSRADRVKGFSVLNTSSWERTGLVILSKAQSTFGDVIIDGQGKKYPSQRLSDGRLAFIARNVPSLGSKTFYNKKGKSSYKSELKIYNNIIENKSIRLELDESTGAIKSLINKRSGREFVDREKYMGLNQYIYVPGRDPAKAVSVTNVQINVKENGPLISAFEVIAKAPGTHHLVQEISLINEINKISIKNTVDKKKVRKKESVHFAVPVDVQNGQLRINIGTGVIEPNTDQLVGANKDYISMNRWADVSNSREGITFITNEVPLIEVGELVDETPVDSSNSFGGLSVEKEWKEKAPDSNTFFSYVMNNYWYTNYKAAQEGSVTFHYSLYLHDRFDSAEATRKARDDGQPLLVTTKEFKGVLPFKLGNKNILLTSVRPAASGRGIILRFFNASPKQQQFVLKWKTDDKNKTSKIYLYNPNGDKQKLFDLQKPWPAFDVKTLYVENSPHRTIER